MIRSRRTSLSRYLTAANNSQMFLIYKMSGKVLSSDKVILATIKKATQKKRHLLMVMLGLSAAATTSIGQAANLNA